MSARWSKGEMTLAWKAYEWWMARPRPTPLILASERLWDQLQRMKAVHPYRTWEACSSMIYAIKQGYKDGQR